MRIKNFKKFKVIAIKHDKMQNNGLSYVCPLDETLMVLNYFLIIQKIKYDKTLSM